MKTQFLKPYHTVEQLESLYRSAENPVERSRWHILWLRKRGFPVKEIINITSFAEPTIRALFSAYNKDGEKAVEDKRRYNGAARKLSKEQEEKLDGILKGASPEEDWTSDKVRLIIEKEFGIKLTKVCAWWYIKRLNYTLQVPRPKHPQSATEEEKEQFIKK